MRDPDVPPKSRQPVRATALALVAVTGGLFLLWRGRQGPERLTEFPPGSRSDPAGVVGEEVFLRHSTPDQSTLDIRAMSLRGGAERPVFRAANFKSVISEWEFRSMEFTRKGIYFRTSDPLDVDQPPLVIGPQPVLRLPQPPPTHRTWERRPRVRIWHVPLSGGTPRELFPDRPAIQRMVVGDYCYWLESELLGPGKPLVTPVDTPPKLKLMAAPLSGGAVRMVAELRADSGVTAGSRGVFWTTGPGRQTELVYTRPPDFSLSVIPNVYRFEPPCEIGDRLYWLDGADSTPSNGVKRPHQVVSIAVDGSDRRVDVDVARKLPGEPVLSGLFDDGRSLLVERVRNVVTPGMTLPKQEHTLCLVRLRTGDLRPLVHWKIDENRSMLGTDGGFAYYTVSEPRENWLDWSAKGLERRTVRQLSRVRLPR